MTRRRNRALPNPSYLLFCVLCRSGNLAEARFSGTVLSPAAARFIRRSGCPAGATALRKCLPPVLKPLSFLGRLRHARRGQGRVIAQEYFVGGFADENAAAAGQPFEAAGEVHFPAEDGVISLANTRLGFRSHQTYRGRAGINAGSQQQQRQRGFGFEAGSDAREIFRFAHFVRFGALPIQLEDRPLCIDCGPNGGHGMVRGRNRRSPESHYAIADKFVERGVMLDDGIGNDAKIQIDGGQRFARIFVIVDFRFLDGQFVGGNVLSRLLLSRVGKFGETTHVGKEHGHFPARPSRERAFRP